MSEAQMEIERLTGALKAANLQAEHFEREWYLRGDEIERLRNVVELLAAPLAIDGPNHAADVKRARDMLTHNISIHAGAKRIA